MRASRGSYHFALSHLPKSMIQQHFFLTRSELVRLCTDDGSHSAKDGCFPIPFLLWRTMLTQEGRNVKNGSCCKVVNNPAGPSLQFGTFIATIPSYAESTMSGFGLWADNFKPLEHNHGSGGLHCHALDHILVSVKGDLLDQIACTSKTVSFK